MWNITHEIRMRCGPPGAAEPYGRRYIIDFDLVRQGGTVRIRQHGRIEEDSPRLTSGYIL
jgi:hypothetical protein